MKKMIPYVMIALLFVASSAIAGTEKGYKEIQLQGSFVNTTNSENDDSTSMAMFQGSLNYFLTDWFSLGGSARIDSSVSSYEDSSEDTTMSTVFFMGNCDLYLGRPESSVVPYIGLRLGIVSYTMESGDYEDSASEVSMGGHAGLKYFPMENVSCNAEFDITTYEQESDYDNTTITNTSLLLGLSYYF
jgi:opacity protein-like surface antigen